MILDVTRPETAHSVGTELATSTAQLAEQLAGGAIASVTDLEQFVRARQEIGDAAGRVVKFFAPLKQMAHQLHKALCDRENAILAPLLRLDRAKRDAISAYKAEQDRLRREQERIAADQQRRERETAAAAEAAALERAHDHALAAAVLEEAIQAPAPVVVLTDVTKHVEGLKFVRRWAFRITNPALIPREFLMVDEKKIGAYARSMKGSGAIPGVEMYYLDDPIR